jgi:hypothetical protein
MNHILLVLLRFVLSFWWNLQFKWGLNFVIILIILMNLDFVRFDDIYQLLAKNGMLIMLFCNIRFKVVEKSQSIVNIKEIAFKPKYSH